MREARTQGAPVAGGYGRARGRRIAPPSALRRPEATYRNELSGHHAREDEPGSDPPGHAQALIGQQIAEHPGEHRFHGQDDGRARRRRVLLREGLHVEGHRRGEDAVTTRAKSTEGSRGRARAGDSPVSRARHGGDRRHHRDRRELHERQHRGVVTPGVRAGHEDVHGEADRAQEDQPVPQQTQSARAPGEKVESGRREQDAGKAPPRIQVRQTNPCSTGTSTTINPVMKPALEAVVRSRPNVWNT